VEATPRDDAEILLALATSGARLLLIGRRAVIAYGVPVVTADYDVWIHIDDIELLNAAMEKLEYVPNHPPPDARRRGRYVLENSEHIDVLVARAKSTPDGVALDFETAWSRRDPKPIAEGVAIGLPCLEDLITTKKWGGRARDIADIEHLSALLGRES
jgi:hypothetical protein